MQQKQIKKVLKKLSRRDLIALAKLLDAIPARTQMTKFELRFRLSSLLESGRLGFKNTRPLFGTCKTELLHPGVSSLDQKMTMPHLQNCEHSPNGWCLDCVKKLWESLDSRCECRFEKGVMIEECHYHACNRSGTGPNGDPIDWLDVPEGKEPMVGGPTTGNTLHARIKQLEQQ